MALCASTIWTPWRYQRPSVDSTRKFHLLLWNRQAQMWLTSGLRVDNRRVSPHQMFVLTFVESRSSPSPLSPTKQWYWMHQTRSRPSVHVKVVIHWTKYVPFAALQVFIFYSFPWIPARAISLSVQMTALLVSSSSIAWKLPEWSESTKVYNPIAFFKAFMHLFTDLWLS